jgi:hypothetical protein
VKTAGTGVNAARSFFLVLFAIGAAGAVTLGCGPDEPGGSAAGEPPSPPYNGVKGSYLHTYLGVQKIAPPKEAISFAALVPQATPRPALDSPLYDEAPRARRWARRRASSVFMAGWRPPADVVNRHRLLEVDGTSVSTATSKAYLRRWLWA